MRPLEFVFIQFNILDRGQLAAEIGTSVGTAVSAGLESFELNFLNKVGLEIRSELSRYVQK